MIFRNIYQETYGRPSVGDLILYHGTKQEQGTISVTLLIKEKLYKGFKNNTGDIVKFLNKN